MPLTCSRRQALAGLIGLVHGAGLRAQTAETTAAKGLPLIVFGDASLPPYSFVEQERPAGAHVDLLAALAQAMGRPLDFRLMDWVDAQAAVMRGEGDVLPPIASTASRAEHFAFTQAVSRYDFSLFARKADASRVAQGRLEVLGIGVTPGGYARQHLETRHPTAKLTKVRDTIDGIRRVQMGQIDAFAGNRAATQTVLADLGISGIAEAAAPFAVLDASIAVHRRNPALRAELDAAIDRVRASGTLARIQTRWFGSRQVTLSRDSLWAMAAASAAVTVTTGLGTALLLQRRRLAERDAEIARRREVETSLEAARLESEAARVAAERAGNAKSAFLANMSHEIRTPLNAIVGISRLLRDSTSPPAQTAQRLRTMDEAAQHLLAMLSDVLDMSKIEAGTLALEDVPFDLPALLESLRSDFEPLAAAKGLLLTIEFDPHCRRVRGDPTRLRQALGNLVSNAIKFTDRGHVRVRQRQVAQDAAGVTLGFEVEDTGSGVPSDLQGRLFRPFEQADGLAARQLGGTGLGLSITQRLVSMMAGEIGHEPTAEAGSLFWFTVRVQPVEAGSPEPARPPEISTAELLRQRWARARILVAEDNEVNLMVTRHMLMEAGLEVLEARDGHQAVQVATAERPALVLMDMRMPEMDGIQATEALRQTFSKDALPIIALTANAFEEDRRACLRAGMNAFLTKPVDAESLYQAVLEWLERGRLGQA